MKKDKVSKKNKDTEEDIEILPKKRKRIKQISLSEHKRILRERMLEIRERVLDGYCKCCGQKPCDHSTVACPMEYNEYDRAIEIIDETLDKYNLQADEKDKS